MWHGSLRNENLDNAIEAISCFVNTIGLERKTKVVLLQFH